MRYLNLRNNALISVLAAGVAAVVACSSGTDTPSNNTGATTGTAGATGATGTAATTSGTTSSAATTAAGSTTSAGTGATTTAATGGAGGAASTTTGTTTTGTGGAGGSGPTGPSVCDGKGTRLLALADSKVDDFEGAALSLGWSSFNDVMPTINSFKITQEVGGAVGTGHFGHYAGTGAKTPTLGGFGVGLVFNTAIDTAISQYCVDITAFDGVSFWAKAATAGSRVAVNFIIPETNAVADHGDCAMNCYNHPSKTVSLTTAWALYNVTFAEAVAGTARVKTVIQELGWLSPDATWDFSLDEIQFYKGTPPTGPAGSGDAGP